MDNNTTCPSYRCVTNAKLFGIRQNGRIVILPQTLEIDQSFIESSKELGIPETRFRFAGKCVEKGCKQWKEGRCTLIDHIVAELQSLVESPILLCPIRTTCRWVKQSGFGACKICPYVPTEIAQ